MANIAIDWNERLAGAVAKAAPSVVGIERQRGTGATGTVYSQDGLIVAADHSIVGDSGVIILDSGERRDVEVVGRDPGTDLALLRAASADGLVPLELRDDAGLAVGHTALALGRPGKAIRASFRILGVLADEVRTPGGGRLDRYIETDRGFPRGFSGGPLIDVDGRGIGINTSGLLRGADITVGTATLARVVAELSQHGAIRRGYLGVAVQRIGLPRPLREQRQQRTGVLIVNVEDDSPAARAGLLLGDLVLALGGAAIQSPDELRMFLHDHAGDKMKVELVRAGSLIAVDVEIGERGR